MKKQILLLLSTMASLISVAQFSPLFGVRAGIASSGMQGDAIKSLTNLITYTNGRLTTVNRTGFFAGGYVDIPVGNIVSVEPAAYYSQKGYGLQGSLNIKGLDFLGANAKAQLNAQYIDMPVLLKVNTGGLQLFAGPQVSYLLQADLHTTAGALGFNLLNSTMDATQQFNRWDAGLTAGVGYQFSSGFNIMASYDYGLSKVDANKNLSSYNRAVKAGLGFSF